MRSTSAIALLATLMLLPARAADKKEREKPSGFDAKSLLLGLVARADKDRDGSISTQEFQKLPLLREAKKEQVDGLFASIDTDSNGALSNDELAKGLGKITDLVKSGAAGVDDADTRRQAKRLKRSLKP